MDSHSATEDVLDMWNHQYDYQFGVRVSVREDFDAGLGGTLFDGSIALSRFLESLALDHGGVHLFVLLYPRCFRYLWALPLAFFFCCWCIF